jgi:transcriptional regulator with XRE-family HTH domain
LYQGFDECTAKEASMIGKVVARLRRERGWTQTQLAARTGLTQSHITLIERSANPSITTETLGKLATGFDMNDWELLKLAKETPHEEAAAAVA